MPKVVPPVDWRGTHSRTSQPLKTIYFLVEKIKKAPYNPPMTTVYAVYAGRYDEYHLVQLYTRKEDADKHAASIPKDEAPDVQEETLFDSCPAPINESLLPFSVDGDPQKRCEWCANHSSHGYFEPSLWVMQGSPSHGNRRFTWRGWASDKNDAKIRARAALDTHYAKESPEK